MVVLPTAPCLLLAAGAASNGMRAKGRRHFVQPPLIPFPPSSEPGLRLLGRPPLEEGFAGCARGGRCQSRGGGNTQKPSVYPRAPRMLPKSGARANKRAPPFEKKGGGGRAPAPLLGVSAPRTSSKRGTEKKNTTVSRCFSPARTPRTARAPRAHRVVNSPTVDKLLVKKGIRHPKQKTCQENPERKTPNDAAASISKKKNLRKRMLPTTVWYETSQRAPLRERHSQPLSD